MRSSVIIFLLTLLTSGFGGVILWVMWQVHRIEWLLRQKYTHVSHFYQTEALEFLSKIYPREQAWFYFSMLRSGGNSSLFHRVYDPYRDDWRLKIRAKGRRFQ